MKHDHSKFQRKVGIRDFQRNVYKNLPKENESVLITNRGQAVFCVSALNANATNENNVLTLDGDNTDENNS